MKRSFSFIISLFIAACTHFLNANTIDSSAYHRLVQKGQSEFCQLLDDNDEAIQHGKLEDMHFVILLSDNEPAVNYSVAQTLNGHAPSPTTQAPEADTLNARIRKIYQQYGIELYLIYINSLDIIIHAPLPENVTYQQLFQQKLYDNASNMDSLRLEHEKISNDIIAYTISARQRDCIILSEGEYCGTFSHDGEKRGCWLFCKEFLHQSTTPTYSEIASLYSDFGNRLSNSNNYRHGGVNISAEAAVYEFGQAAKYVKLRNDLLSVYTPSEIKDILHDFNYPADYTGLTIEQRRHVLSVFAGYTMLGTTLYWQGEEGLAIKVIASTPTKDVESLLYVLSQPNYLHNNSNYHGTTSDRALILFLMARTDDGILTNEDNYQKLITTIGNLLTSDDQIMANHLPRDDAGWHSRQIYWGATYKDGVAEIGSPRYDITLVGDGSVIVSKDVVARWDAFAYDNATGKTLYNAVWENDTAFSLRPFDLIMFTNRSDVGMIASAGAQRGKVFVAPAIFLKYAEDKTFNQYALKTASVALDVIGLAAGPAAIIGAIEVGDLAVATFEALQFIGSAEHLAVDQVTDPVVRSLLEKYNMIVGVWGFARLGVSVGKFATSFYSEVKAGTVNAIPKSVANDFKTTYAQAESELGELSVADKGRVGKMEEYLEGELGKSLANEFAQGEIPFINGYTKEQILAIPKGERPNPSTYLDANYISFHINAFNNEGGAFIVVKSWIERGTYPQFPMRKFVGLASEMQNVIEKYRAANNDWRIIRDELNLGETVDLSNDEIYLVRISPGDSRFSYEIPNGNEAGAIPGEWVPGGKTKNGVDEAVLIGSEKLVHDHNVNTLLSYFSASNWEKIK